MLNSTTKPIHSTMPSSEACDDEKKISLQNYDASFNASAHVEKHLTTFRVCKLMWRPSIDSHDSVQLV